MEISSKAVSSNLVGKLSEPARRTREDLATLSLELATGDKSDVGQAVNHDFSALGLISRDLTIANSLHASIERGRRITGTAQAALGGIRDQLSSLNMELVPMVSGGQADPAVLVVAAEQAFVRVISFLNTQQDDGSIFSAGRSDANAVSDADTILSALRSDLVGNTGPDDIVLRVETFFEPGGAFETNFVTPGSPAEFGFRVESDRTESFDLRADDQRFARALQSIGTLLGVLESPFADGPSGQAYLAIQATSDLATAQDGIIELAAETGRIEGRLEKSKADLETRIFKAQQARLELIGVDPFETATMLQEETTRLETIYSMTARLSGLRLTNFL